MGSSGTRRCLIVIVLVSLFISFLYLQNSCRAARVDDDVVYTRHDRDAYLATRRDPRGSSGGDGGSSPEDRTRKIDRGGDDGRRLHRHDDPDGCTTYLAPSSIPDSGLGMYTAAAYRRGEPFPYPEIGILLQEKSHHSPKKRHGLLAQYPWSAQVLTLGGHEVGYGESCVPGPGMLANSHLGLANLRHSEVWKHKPWTDGTDSPFREESLTADDPGRGAHSHHSRVVFEAQAPIQAGEELFVSYGDGWFTARESLLGIVPGKEQFEEADELLRSLALEAEKRGGDITDSVDYERSLREASKKDKRLRAALPDNLRDVPAALASGTARFSARESIRSVEWLRDNAACIDNIVAGTSTIPQAGRGAFATRSVGAGERIAATPAITLEREELFLWGDVRRVEGGGGARDLVGHQLLLNYCYGHAGSSLLFFPYSPTVNFINHGDGDAFNAEIRWSKMPHHKAEWLDATLDDMKAKLKTGLMFDIIATRDIRRGEEVLLHYGKDWEESWREHVDVWGVNDDRTHLNLTERLLLPTILDFNQIEQHPTVRTMREQSDDPYPAHIMTRCQFMPPENCTSPDLCQSRWTMTFDPLHLHPCSILYRHPIGRMDWYTARVEVPSEGGAGVALHFVEYMPRSAIRLVGRPYSKDQYARGVFRHAIGLPDGIVPAHWMDLDIDGERSFSSPNV